MYDDAHELQLHRLCLDDFNDLVAVCKHFHRRTETNGTRLVIHQLLTRDVGEPLIILLNHLLAAAYGREDINTTRNKLIKLRPVGSSSVRRMLSVLQVVRIIESYEPIRRVQGILTCNEVAVRSEWQKSDLEIAALAGPRVTAENVQDAKIRLVKEWFSNKGLGEPSDEQAIVIANCHNSLKVVARAGSGKTRTVAQKILFLVHYLRHRRDEIIALVFNGKAMKELDQRIRQYELQADLPVSGSYKVLTFDALAYNLVNPQATLLVDPELGGLIKGIVLDAMNNEEELRCQVEQMMLKSFNRDWDKIIRMNNASTEADLARLRSFLTEQSIDGKDVKSKPEKRISDFLFEHDIPYYYEFPFLVDDGHVVRPDFYIPTHRVVIEYYGLRGDSDYERAIRYKREFWASQRHITLIEINPDFFDTRSDYDSCREADYQRLAALLSTRTAHLPNQIQPQRLSDQEILSRLWNDIQLDFCELVKSAIVRSGQMMWSDSTLMDQIAQYQASSQEERSFLDILPTFLMMYKDRLANNNLVDFSCIKKMAIDQIVSGKTVLDWDQGRNGIDLKDLKYIFVDEFQDFSELFRGLLLAILRLAPSALVNAVGDDWQMINRFAGSKPELFDQFDDDYPRPFTVYLCTNYRSAGGIVDFCNAVMSTNGVNGMAPTSCHALRNSPCIIARLDRDELKVTPRETHYFNGDSLLSAIFRLYKPFTEEFIVSPNKDDARICFAISRTNDPPLRVDVGRLGIRARSKRQIINSVVDKFTPDTASKFFEAVTGHKCKGLEAHAVVVLQPRQFPAIHQRSIFLRFFGDTPENLLRDELNLFYVACSRAKSSLYFLPECGYMMSPFLSKLASRIDVQLWSRFPCRLAGPRSLHQLSVQSRDGGSRDLFQAQDILKSFGLVSFGRPKQIPTRSLMVRRDYLGTLLYLQRVVEACNEFDLRYIIRDGLGQEIFLYPGPVSIDQAICDARGEA